MTEPALAIDSLSFCIGGRAILRNVSAQIAEGETWSVIGANGAGKSTLLKCLMRIHTGWTGRLRLRGRDLAALSQRELARQVAYVPQPGADQQFPYTVREFIRMGRYAYSGPFGSAHAGDGEAIRAAMQRTHVEDLGDRMLETLSGGERQKVFIAAALAQGSDILLLDEPTAFLDYRHQAEVAEILHAINRQSRGTVISVTHDVNAAVLAGGHVLALRQGEVAWTGPVEELTCESTLQQIFGASFRFIDDPVTGLRLVAPQGGAR